MTIPQKHIDFAKDNLACIAVIYCIVQNDMENTKESECEDGDWQHKILASFY